jgi:thiol-disulfide isomerase/thioredoxin
MAGKSNGFFLGCLTALSALVVLAGVLVGASYIFKEQIVRASMGRLRPPALAHGLSTGYDWPIATLDGAEVAATDFAGKPVFFHVWHPGCPECLAELAGIDALRRRLEDADIAFVIVAGTRAEEAAEAAATYGYAGPLYKTTAPLPAPFDTDAVPMTYLIAPGGEVVHVERGSAQWNVDHAENFLRSLAGDGITSRQQDQSDRSDRSDQSDPSDPSDPADPSDSAP